MDEAISSTSNASTTYSIGERTAEAIKIALGARFPLDERLSMEVRGRNLTRVFQ